jgi:peptidase E
MEENSWKKIYFLGGESAAKRNARSINVAAFEDAGSSPRVLVFPWARPSFDSHYRRRKLVNNYFRCLGAKSVEFIDFSETIENIVDKSKESDLIYLTGGQVSVLLNRLRSTGMDKVLRNFKGVIVGRSAGAMVLGKECLVTGRYRSQSNVVPGIRLVDFSVKAHYDPAKDKLLKQLSETQRIYAIRERSALVLRNGALSVFGEVVLFENRAKTIIF